MMKYSLTNFPIEVQEMILSKLDGFNLITMAKVCKLWQTICGWIAKETFSKFIPQECVREIENNGIKGDDIWLTALNYHYLSKFAANSMCDEKKNVCVELNENSYLCFCIYGPLIFIGCDSSEIKVYNPEESSQPVLKIKLQETFIFQIEIMTREKLLLAKSGRNDLTFFSLPYYSGKSWVYEMTQLKPNVQNLTEELLCERNFSICGSILALASTVHQVCVLEVHSVAKKSVDLKCVTNYIAEEPVGHVAVWQDEVIILLKGGEIIRWCLVSQNTFMSERYHEIHYGNPVWIFRGRIFCSTFISSQLLGYWHMDRGADYWLVGKPYCDLVRCRDLGTMFNDDTTSEDVLCVCLKQRLLACGTSNGNILIYYLSDNFFSSEDINKSGNEHMRREFNRRPDLIIRTKERPLRDVQIQFDENCIKIYAWPFMVNGSPGLKGFLQCITLKERVEIGQGKEVFADP